MVVEYLTDSVFLGLTIEQIGIIIGIVCGIIGILRAENAMKISKFAMLPDIEFKYILKDINPKYLEEQHKYKENFDKFNSKYTNQYSHLIIVNKGNGKASDIDVAYNWELDEEAASEGDILLGGYSSKYLDLEGYEVMCERYIFPGDELVDIPVIDFGRDEYEKARLIMIRVKYKDSLGNTYCKCKYFQKRQMERGFDVLTRHGRTCRIGLLKTLCIKLLGERSCKFEDKSFLYLLEFIRFNKVR